MPNADLLRLLQQGSGGASVQLDPTSQQSQDLLRIAQQFDPNARFQTQHDDQSGQDRTNLVYAMDKLPAFADNTKYGQVDPQGHQIYTPMVGNPGEIWKTGVESLKNPADIWNDPIYGQTTHSGNININESRNNAQQRTLLDTIMPMLVLGIGGLAGGGGFLNSLITKGMGSFTGQNPLATIQRLLGGKG